MKTIAELGLFNSVTPEIKSSLEKFAFCIDVNIKNVLTWFVKASFYRSMQMTHDKYAGLTLFFHHVIRI